MSLKHYKKSFEVKPENTSLLVAEAFGIGPGWVNNIVDVELPLPLPQITLVSGESGCGKSTLLRELGQPTSFKPPSKPLHAWCEPDEKALQLLNSVGLNDASLFVLHYNQLSDSQQARARMYFWLCQGEKTLVIDEFLATLDRKTAQALAYSFQRMLRREGLSLIAATAQNDLVPFLQPDLLVEGRAFPSRWTTHIRVEEPIVNSFESTIHVAQETEKSTHVTPGGTCNNCKKGVECKCKVPDKNISAGKDAYRDSRLGEIHYKGKYVGGRQEYFSARLDGEAIGWLVGTLSMSKTWRIARVVVHPTYRGCGVGQRLIKKYLELRPDADTVAAMARFNPVFERAGMRRVEDVVIKPPKFLKDFPLTPAKWADKEECSKVMKNPELFKLVCLHADELGLDIHPGGKRPDNMSRFFRDNPDYAAHALWRVRPRRMAKYVGPKHKLFAGELNG
jgi:ABC-type lipoprotein export system ATPase subunit/GNAT superfamily N-acetyltransferase